jgi:hypothetical protein
MMDYGRYPTPIWALQVWRQDGVWTTEVTGRAGTMMRLCRYLREQGTRCRVRIRYSDGGA